MPADMQENHDALAAASPSFSLLQAKTMTSQVLLACWCPTMDLLASVTQDNQLSIHRLDWQKLWVACPSTPITALCWKPDGKEVVTGHRDGSIRHYNVERCELCHEAASPTAPHAGASINHLSWVEADAGMQSTPMLQHLKLRHTCFFSRPPLTSDPAPKPPTPSDLDLSKSGQGPSRAVQWPPPPKALHLLVSCDARGLVCISAYGQLHLATVDARLACGVECGPGVQLQAHMSRDLCNLEVLVQRDDQQQQGGAPSSPQAVQGTSAGGRSRTVGAVVYRSRVLQSPHVMQLAVQAIHLREVIAAAQQGISAAFKEWQAAQEELRKRLGQLAQSLRDHAVMTPLEQQQQQQQQGSADWMEDEELVEGELVCLLASGHVSPGMHAFLTSTLAEHGLRRLAKVVDGAVQAVHALLLDQVQPATEVAAFLLGEIKGLALAGSVSGCGSLGLQAHQVCVAELEASKALLQCEALRLAVTSVGCKLRSFFNWLHKTWYQLEGLGKDAGWPGSGGGGPPGPNPTADIRDILDLLAGHLNRDTILADLQEGPTYLDGDIADQVASLGFPQSAVLEEAKRMMELMYSPLIPADIAARLPGAGQAGVCSPGSRAPPEPAPSTWPSRPLRAQLKLVSTLCEEVLLAVPAAVSPSLTPTLKVPLAHIQPDLDLGPLLCRTSCPPLKPDPGAPPSRRVCVLVPGAPSPGRATEPGLSTEQDLLLLADLGSLGGAAGGAGPGPGTNVGDGQTQAAAPTASLLVRACAVRVPRGFLVQDFAFYRDGQLGMVLSHSSGGAASAAAAGGPPATAAGPAAVQAQADGHAAVVEEEPDGESGDGEAEGAAACGGSYLVLLQAEQLQLQEVTVGPTGGACLLQACLRQAAVSSLSLEGVRSRVCPQGIFEPPLALSAPRGVVALFTDNLRAFTLDLEEDEEGEEQGEGSSEGDAEGMDA